MLITSLEAVSKTRTRVTFDHDTTLVLSNKEITVYGLVQDHEIDESVYGEIVEAQKGAALKYAGRLLKDLDYTTARLRTKMLRAGYPEEAVEDTIERLIDAGYVNDRRYAQAFLRLHLSDRSIMRICSDLQRKGIDKDLVAEVLREYDEENTSGIHGQETAQIRRYLLRKHYRPGRTSYEERTRIKVALVRRGYSIDNIRKAMQSIN